MKKKNFFMLALAAIAFAACSNEEIVPGGENDGTDVTNSDGDAWVALSVRTPAKTRGLNDPNQENGTQDESTITKVKAIFFNGHVLASTVTKVVDFSDDDVANIPNRSSAFKVPSTSKSVLIVANPQSLGLPTISEGMTYEDINEVITLAAVNDVTATGNVAKSGAFAMTNAKGGLEPSTGVGNAMVAADLTLHSTPTAATSDPLTLRIDRISAKVRVYVKPLESQVLSTTATIDLDVTKWYLNVTNRKFFPVSVRAKTFKNSWTPYDQYEIGSYRVDPNYEMSEIGVWVSNTNHAEYDNNYFYVTSSTNSIGWNDLSTAKYCLENTQEEEANVHAYTTHVLLKVGYAPNSIKNLDGTSVTVDSGDDWFNMNGVFYTPVSILTYIEDELVKKYKDKNPATYPTKITNAYNEYIQALGLTQVTIPDALEDLKTAEQQGAEYAAKFGGTLAASIATASEGGKNLKGVEYYSEGICYYKIMIKHDNDDSESVMNKLGEFGVVRNSVYDITVNKINNPGYPSIPDPDPSAPDEDLDRYLSIQIETNPWTWYTQAVEL